MSPFSSFLCSQDLFAYLHDSGCARLRLVSCDRQLVAEHFTADEYCFRLCLLQFLLQYVDAVSYDKNTFSSEGFGQKSD
jgi:hypothetical protein